MQLAGFALALSFIFLTPGAFGFEGRIHADIIQGAQSTPLLYTVGTNFLRVEMTETNWPNPVDIVDRDSGALTLLFPHNRSFVRLKARAENASARAGLSQMPAGPPPGVVSQPPSSLRQPARPNGMPPGIGPTNFPGMPAMTGPIPGLPPGVGPSPPSIVSGASAMSAMPSVGGMPAMPAMPMMPMERMELIATGEKTNLLGFACEEFELKQRGEVMDIWATDQLLPFQNYIRNQSPRFGPRMIEERWAGLLTAKKLFPLRASLRFENGPERYRFEVKTITPQNLAEEDLRLFQPPDGYFEIQPLPF